MTTLTDELANVVAKHAEGLTAKEWYTACKQVMHGYFPSIECPAVFDETEVLQAVDMAIEKHFPVLATEGEPM